MSGQRFTFPPPPPAPPKDFPSYVGVSQPFGGANSYRGKEDGRDYGNRGWGRGSNRGGRRGGPFGSSPSRSGYSNPSFGVNKRQSSAPDMGHNARTNDYKRSRYPLPGYPPVQLPQLPTNVHQGYGLQTPAFPANARPPQVAHTTHGNSSYQIYNGQHQPFPHGYGPSLPSVQMTLPTASNDDSFQIKSHPGQPVLMGPPIRMGFDAGRNSSQTPPNAQPTADGNSAHQQRQSDGNMSPYRYSSPIGLHSVSHESSSTFLGSRGRGQKREHGLTHRRPQNRSQQIQVTPAVPSFGGPLSLPLKPPVLHGSTRRPKKKKRKHNQLGLTPKTEEHESSEEEDDTDEEARLAAVAASAGQGRQLLQFDYKGRTSTLRSSSDIAAWIEERKKRFPTKARAAEIAEARRQGGNRQKPTDQIPREAHGKLKTEVWKTKRQQARGEKEQRNGEDAFEEAAAKSKRKVEKLRKQLKKEERRIAKAEAKASKNKMKHSADASRMNVSALGNNIQKRKRSSSGESGNASGDDADLAQPRPQEAANIVPDPLTPTSQPGLADEERVAPPHSLDADSAPDQLSFPTRQEGDEPSFPCIDPSVHDSSLSQFSSSSDSSSTSKDETSSSGSSSDCDSDDGPPDETSTKRAGPERAAVSKFAKPKQVCRAFLHKGSCKRGSSCKYLHKSPERESRGAGSRGVKRAEGRKERVGLYQRLVKLEKEQEDREIIGAILHLGERGLLENGVRATDGEGKAS